MHDLELVAARVEGETDDVGDGQGGRDREQPPEQEAQRS